MSQEFWLGASAGAVILAVLVVGMLFVTGGPRVGLGLKALGRTLKSPEFAARIEPLLNLRPEPPKPVKPSGAPLRMLAVLQREGRLVDFLMEDITGYPDAQVGFAVREMHKQCQEALKKALDLEPVLPQQQDETVEVAAGFDPSAVRLTGNVTGTPPFKGTVKHQGWRVKQMRVAAPPEGVDEFVLMPAEVEMP
ncbi:MAG: DUF2760 domain-containing protein [Gemmataceae bacterium]